MNKVILMIGASGSGKSTAARKIKNEIDCETPDIGDDVMVDIVSADHYWEAEGGLYKFEPSKLSFAHDFCKMKFAHYIAQMLEHPTLSHVLVVDNTNTTKAERYFYELMAQKFGYEVELRKMEEENPDVLFARNVHNVPLETIQKQIERIKSGK